MKTLTSICLLSGCVFLTGIDRAEAQSSRSTLLRRLVFSQPTFAVGRTAVPHPVVTYGGFSHIDELAVELEQRARDILWEMHFNYAHNPGFRTTYAEAYIMLRQAKSIHRAEHRGDRAAIVRLVTELDGLFHHVEEDICTWRPSHRHLDGHGTLFDRMEAMEETLHHLMQDVGVTASTADPPIPGSYGDPTAPAFNSPQPSLTRVWRR